MRIREYSHYEIPYLDIATYQMDKEVMGIIPLDVSLKLNVVALDRFKNVLTVVMGLPTWELIKQVEAITGHKVLVFLGDSAKIHNVLLENQPQGEAIEKV